MSLKTSGLVGSLLVVASASALLFWGTHGESAVRPESREPAETTATPRASRVQPGTPFRVPHLPISDATTHFEAARASVWLRPYFTRWVERAKLTAEEEESALQILSDAQAIYNESADVRDALKARARRLRQARITPAQRARLAPVLEQDRARVDGLLTGAAAEAAEHLYRETWEAVDAELDATMPESERQANEDAEQVDRDLEAEVKAAFSEFLTAEQIESFDLELASVSDFLRRNYRPYAAAQHAEELASRRR